MTKPGPRIIASEVIHDLSDITSAWKIAAVRGPFGAWEWLCGYEAGKRINDQLYTERDGPPRTLSGVQGQQRWNGHDRWVLYVRKLPAGVE